METDREALKTILQKIASLLQRRSLSEKELRRKLAGKFSQSLIDKAIDRAKSQKWLQPEEELRDRITARLNEKNKSKAYIKNYLLEKGLPLPVFCHEEELKKASRLLNLKKASFKNQTFKEKTKLKQFLAYRGFAPDIANQLLD